MKLVNRKMRKTIKKSVKKAMKQHGPALVAALIAGLTSSVGTLATTEAADRPGKSNLEDVAERAKKVVAGGDTKKSRKRRAKREARRPSSPDREDARAPGDINGAHQPRLT